MKDETEKFNPGRRGCDNCHYGHTYKGPGSDLLWWGCYHPEGAKEPIGFTYINGRNGPEMVGSCLDYVPKYFIVVYGDIAEK